MGYILLGILVIIVIAVISIYNSLVRKKNMVEEGFSTIDVYLKKRYDLVPNLVETVKGYASHEKETLQGVIEARNMAMSASNPEAQFEAEGQLSQVLGRLFALSESYPDLKANTNFMDLQGQLKSLETEIAQSRKYYNAVTREYNVQTETFPSVIVANMFGFKRMPLYEVEQEHERQNVKIEF
ncbi:LemA family protein [Erysipelothrix urinaevulpis]|uniref:LemA family protein n=1 Tax=Erysipelothrix urinaevulpis TaxID=2683717 RepID=UPI001358BF6C|nr:LemA family protein [Erysipelothrix urinaevulpis]